MNIFICLKRVFTRKPEPKDKDIIVYINGKPTPVPSCRNCIVFNSDFRRWYPNNKPGDIIKLGINYYQLVDSPDMKEVKP